MARRRNYGEDLTYAEEHRHKLEELYRRDGHRLSMADRDWTEFGHRCHRPLVVVEEYQDRGQNLLDKRTTVTQHLARAAGVQAWQMAWRSERPSEAQREVDALNRRLREIEQAWPIIGFSARQLVPSGARRLRTYAPKEWWQVVRAWHRRHHAECRDCGAAVPAVDVGRLRQTEQALGIALPMPRLPERGAA